MLSSRPWRATRERMVLIKGLSAVLQVTQWVGECWDFSQLPLRKLIFPQNSFSYYKIGLLLSVATTNKSTKLES